MPVENKIVEILALTKLHVTLYKSLADIICARRNAVSVSQQKKKLKNKGSADDVETTLIYFIIMVFVSSQQWNNKTQHIKLPQIDWSKRPYCSGCDEMSLAISVVSFLCRGSPRLYIFSKLVICSNPAPFQVGVLRYFIIIIFFFI